VLWLLLAISLALFTVLLEQTWYGFSHPLAECLRGVYRWIPVYGHDRRIRFATPAGKTGGRRKPE
jgi:hypothetical protein